MFDISSVEAAWMDPQQKQLLEVVYEAIENSGCTISEVSEAATGCIVGSFTNDFQQTAMKERARLLPHICYDRNRSQHPG